MDNSDVGKLKIVPVDLKKLSDLEDNEIVKNTKFNTLKENSWCNCFNTHKLIQHR